MALRWNRIETGPIKGSIIVKEDRCSNEMSYGARPLKNSFLYMLARAHCSLGLKFCHFKELFSNKETFEIAAFAPSA